MSRLLNPIVLASLILAITGTCAAQAGKSSSVADVSAIANHNASLAESGHCAEALPHLKKAIRQLLDK
jgi:hypothetical protein